MKMKAALLNLTLMASLLLQSIVSVEAQSRFQNKERSKKPAATSSCGTPYAKKHSIFVDSTGTGVPKLIASDIVFVDNTSSPGGDGTYEHPVNTIQAGEIVAEFLGFTRVFVFGRGIPYVEDITIITPLGLEIWGSGKGFPTGCGQPFKGKGSTPLVVGGFLIQDLPFFSLDGFEIVKGFAGGSGIDVQNTIRTSLTCNDLHDLGGANLVDYGIYLSYYGETSGSSLIKENLIEYTDTKSAITIHTLDDSYVTAKVTDNQLIANDGSGISTNAHSTSELKATITSNTYKGNGEFGFGLSAVTFDSALGNFNLSDNTVIFSGNAGINVNSVTDSTGVFKIAKNTVTLSEHNGIFLGAQANGNVSCELLQNTVSTSGDSGILIQTSGNSLLNSLVESNSISDNGAGFLFKEAVGSFLSVAGAVNNSTGTGNTLNEVESLGNPSGSFILNGGLTILPTTIP